MRPRTQAFLALAGLAFGLTGCVPLKRTPEARFFHLRALAEPAEAAAVDGDLVAVMPARLPGHLERPQLVTEVAPGELRVDEFLRWAEPIDAGVTRTLAENLARLLPEHRVVRFPWRSQVAPRCRVVLELTDFGLHGRTEARLAGRWALLRPDREGAFVARSVALQREGGADAGASVEAMSALLAELSQQIAAGVRSLPPAPAPVP
jgi:hypothetical protein